MADDLFMLFRRELAAFTWREGVSQAFEVDAAAARLAEVAAGHYESWDGLMSILDRHYPADVRVLCDENSPDPGPRIVALIRHLDAARRELADLEAEVQEMVKHPEYLRPDQRAIARALASREEAPHA